MDVALARQYQKRLAELVNDLAKADHQARAGILLRMRNLIIPLYPVHSGAALAFEEAMAQLKHPAAPVANAALRTMQEALLQLQERIQAHADAHFVLQGPERIFAKPVAEDELRSFVEKGRLMHENHDPFVLALAVEGNLERVMLRADRELLEPVFMRMGFPNPEAVLFFKTRSIPSVLHPHEEIPSMRIAKLRSGIPVTVLKHRIL